MSSPIKPWEGAGINSRANTPIRSSLNPRPATPYGNKPNNLIRGSSSSATMGDSVPDCCKNPPVPTRPPRSTYSSIGGYNGGMLGGYGGYGNSMYGYGGGYGTGMYGGFGSGFGGYGSGYGGYGRFSNYGNQAMQSSSFVRRAEESSRAAFQSVESIVQAFGSISMMLESTHFAMINTFRAVLGAADHLSRMKSHILSAIGAIAIIKTLKTICKKVLYMLGLIKNSGLENEVWTEAVNSSVVGTVGSEASSKNNTKSWPIVMFFAVVLGVPWILWKLLKSLAAEEDDTKNWMTGTGDHVLARVEYDFVGEAEDELSASAGSIIKVAPKDQQPHIRGWLLATVDGEKEGIIPANYVKILGLQRGNNLKSEGNPPDANMSSTSAQIPQASSSSSDAQCCSQKTGSSSTNVPNKSAELNTLDFEMPADTDFFEDVAT